MTSNRIFRSTLSLLVSLVYSHSVLASHSSEFHDAESIQGFGPEAPTSYATAGTGLQTQATASGDATDGTLGFNFYTPTDNFFSYGVLDALPDNLSDNIGNERFVKMAFDIFFYSPTVPITDGLMQLDIDFNASGETTTAQIDPALFIHTAVVGELAYDDGFTTFPNPFYPLPVYHIETQFPLVDIGSFTFNIEATPLTGPADLTFGVDNIHLDWASAVPIPGAAWLFGSGLIGLIGVARHKISV